MMQPVTVSILVLLLCATGGCVWFANKFVAARREIKKAFPRRMRDVFLVKGGSLAPGRNVLLGDSMIQCLDVANLPNAVEFGVAGAKAGEIAALIPSLVFLDQAASIVVTCGVNDLFTSSHAQTIDRMRDILAALPSGVPIIVTEVLPVNEDKLGPIAVGVNLRVSALNAGYESLCGAWPNCTFVPMRAFNARLGLASEHDAGDGIHLSLKGYEEWIAGVLPYLTPSASHERGVAENHPL